MIQKEAWLKVIADESQYRSALEELRRTPPENVEAVQRILHLAKRMGKRLELWKDFPNHYLYLNRSAREMDYVDYIDHLWEAFKLADTDTTWKWANSLSSDERKALLPSFSFTAYEEDSETRRVLNGIEVLTDPIELDFTEDTIASGLQRLDAIQFTSLVRVEGLKLGQGGRGSQQDIPVFSREIKPRRADQPDRLWNFYVHMQKVPQNHYQYHPFETVWPYVEQWVSRK